MKKFTLLIFGLFVCLIVFGQTHDDQEYYDVKQGSKKGVRFWDGSDWYSLSMGYGEFYNLGNVTGHSLKMTMTGSHSRGFVWGERDAVPIASLSLDGHFQIQNRFYFDGIRGMLAVGLVNPAYSLHIEGKDIFLQNPTSGSSLHFRTDNNGDAFINNMNNFVGNGSTGNGSLVFTSQNSLLFRTGNLLSSGTNRMTISNDGAVAINKTPDIIESTFMIRSYEGSQHIARFYGSDTKRFTFNGTTNDTYSFYVHDEATGEAKDLVLGHTDYKYALVVRGGSGAIGLGVQPNGASKFDVKPNGQSLAARFYSSETSANRRLTIKTPINSTENFFLYVYNEETKVRETLYIGNSTESGSALVVKGQQKQVGIRTDNIPDGYALAVNGALAATKVTIKTETSWGWPDYVFSENYKLKSLSEVKEFVEENKHLPDVPSAAEVDENGVDLGNMDAILLKKIEELTLYMIQLEEKNAELEKKVEQLSNSK